MFPVPDAATPSEPHLGLVDFKYPSLSVDR
jgi:hypothetical protein